MFAPVDDRLSCLLNIFPSLMNAIFPRDIVERFMNILSVTSHQRRSYLSSPERIRRLYEVCALRISMLSRCRRTDKRTKETSFNEMSTDNISFVLRAVVSSWPLNLVSEIDFLVSPANFAFLACPR